MKKNVDIGNLLQKIRQSTPDFSEDAIIRVTASALVFFSPHL